MLIGLYITLYLKFCEEQRLYLINTNTIQLAFYYSRFSVFDNELVITITLIYSDSKKAEPVYDF